MRCLSRNVGIALVVVALLVVGLGIGMWCGDVEEEYCSPALHWSLMVNFMFILLILSEYGRWKRGG